MKRLIEWAIRNSPAMNVLMIASLIIGLISFLVMRREFFPNFDLEVVLVSVPYPGATPEEVEEGICQKLEESLHSVEGIKRMTSVAAEGAGNVVLELKADVSDVQKTIADIKSNVDRITSFPKYAERHEVKQISFPQPAIKLALVGPAIDGDPDLAYDHDLRTVAEEIRAELLQMPPPKPTGSLIGRIIGGFRTGGVRNAISSAEIDAAKKYQINIEIPETQLRSYGLTLQQVADIINSENTNLPGGKMKSASQEILVRGKNKRSLGSEIENIKVRSESDSANVLRIRDIGTVIDGFEDSSLRTRIDGRPGLTLTVERTTNEDLFAVVDVVKAYVVKKKDQLPAGYELKVWDDRSLDVRDRLNLLTKNGAQGLLLVFIVLAVFLELRLAFWVALGIPIAVLGAGYVLIGAGQTLNMLSMFAFLMALGIVVDDAIVIGENIYEHRQRGTFFLQAAINGTVEVMPSVAASVATTIIAFMPLLFVSGVMGKFIAVMPLAVISMLIISLLESTFVLPCHLAHENNLFIRFMAVTLYPFRFVGTFFTIINRYATAGLMGFIDRVYLPTLRFALGNRAIVVSLALGLLIMAGGFVRAGITPFVFFPKLDSRAIIASVAFPSGANKSFTHDAAARLESALLAINEEHLAATGKKLVENMNLTLGEVRTSGMGPASTATGGHLSRVEAQLLPVSERDETSDQIIQRWRERTGEIAGTQYLYFGTPQMGPGGTPIEFKVLADKRYMIELENAVEACKQQLATYEGVIDIRDDSSPGNPELQVRIREDADSLGVTEQELSATVRATYYGVEVDRDQRGRHEVKLMVRYPKEERESLRNFDQIRVRGQSDQLERPITEIANINYTQGYSEINRIDQLRSITVLADVEKSLGGNSALVAENLKSDFIPELKRRFPHVEIRSGKVSGQRAESFQSLAVGFGVAMIAMFVLLTVEFRSYFQPLIIMAIIPFGAIGAILGHAVMQLELTLFSVFGMVALTGVIVNDSIVLVDFINHRVRDGIPLKEALVDAGRRRFRPVLLTSMTTIAGLIPILLETSFQAQVLIPMAASLCFGLMMATSLILILVPVFYDLTQSAIMMLTDLGEMVDGENENEMLADQV